MAIDTILDIKWGQCLKHEVRIKGQLTSEQIVAISDAIEDVTQEKYGDLRGIIEGLGVEIVSVDEGGSIMSAGYYLDDYEEVKEQI